MAPPPDQMPPTNGRREEETIGQRVRRVFRMEQSWRFRPHANDNQAPGSATPPLLRRILAGLLGGFVLALITR